ncbi:MAG TPA: Na+/H+ antiporter [Kofleriaceae bacterium]|jgi:CPA1 family monovalent cation:H+ antiporter
MNSLELILILLATSVALSIAADRIRLPYPIVLVLGGIALAFTPVPRLELPPDVVLVLFLPPLLFAAAWLTSWREFRAHLRTISLLAIGLVVATTCGVALVAHAVIPGMPWSVAFVLGAIVSPPDAVAATSVMQRLRVPARLVTILEGESLVNDATGLVAYQVALAAVAGASFSAAQATTQFAVVGLGGIAFGLAIGWLVSIVHRHLDDFVVETAISLLTPYVAYIPAEHLGMSGVLAAVTAGGFLGWRNPQLLSPLTRLRSRSVWAAVLFVFNSLVFILMGLELAGTHRLFASLPMAGLVGWCAAIAATTIAIRLLWVPIALHLPRWLSPRVRRREPTPAWRDTAVIGWTAMRGIVSLALALALPDVLPDGTPFPLRDLLILVVFVVIATTLLGQGLTLPFVIRAVGFRDDGSEERRTREALLKGSEAALAQLDEIAERLQTPPRIAEIVRTIYTQRCDRLRSNLDGDPTTTVTNEGGHAFRALRAQLIEIERQTLVALRNDGVVSAEILQHLQENLDLEALQPVR